MRFWFRDLGWWVVLAFAQIAVSCKPKTSVWQILVRESMQLLLIVVIREKETKREREREREGVWVTTESQMGKCLLKGTDWPYGSLGRCRPRCTFTVEQVKWRLKLVLEEDKIFPFRRREIWLWWLRQKKHCVEGKEDPNKTQLQQLAPGNWDSHTLLFNLFSPNPQAQSSNVFKSLQGHRF
jgi:hypothetical protein